jgi:hypothetical protein
MRVRKTKRARYCRIVYRGSRWTEGSHLALPYWVLCIKAALNSANTARSGWWQQFSATVRNAYLEGGAIADTYAIMDV